ncbi:hypothetical protein GA0111570_1196 [Raineyella antarctica]|uniref:Sigma-70, region 4 n=1 Tax=Raineyella antarctica TaxID=1577474 RepID=A0A1G6IP14_9ACTN|nr:hypothetical protein [Raineyella antarctica]SDC07745.1 hypothetical protein GA0111570_1196 [Raineyella antarctica]
MKTMNDAADREPDPVEQLADVARRRRELESEEYHHVLQARGQGVSWQEIGWALGMSKQAAHKKFRRKGREASDRLV